MLIKVNTNKTGLFCILHEDFMTGFNEEYNGETYTLRQSIGDSGERKEICHDYLYFDVKMRIIAQTKPNICY
jgi:hypothetical protein